jgi:hypothetical protein
MAKLHIINLESERRVEVVLSRRNLLTLLHKLDMPGSLRQIHNNDCWEDGEQTPWHGDGPSAHPVTMLVLRCEDDEEHYGKRAAGPGAMIGETEEFVAEHGGAPGEVFGISFRLLPPPKDEA